MYMYRKTIIQIHKQQYMYNIIYIYIQIEGLSYISEMLHIYIYIIEIII